MAKKVQKSQIEEIVAQLLEKGRKSGVLTQSEISDALHEQTDLTAEQFQMLRTMIKTMPLNLMMMSMRTVMLRLKKIFPLT